MPGLGFFSEAPITLPKTARTSQTNDIFHRKSRKVRQRIRIPLPNVVPDMKLQNRKQQYTSEIEKMNKRLDDLQYHVSCLHKHLGFHHFEETNRDEAYPEQIQPVEPLPEEQVDLPEKQVDLPEEQVDHPEEHLDLTDLAKSLENTPSVLSPPQVSRNPLPNPPPLAPNPPPPPPNSQSHENRTPQEFNKVFAGDLFMTELRKTIDTRKQKKISKKDKKTLEIK